MTVPRSLTEILAQAEELADTFEAYRPQPGQEGSAATLMSLRLATAHRAAADRAVLDAVSASRAQGISWSAIGKILGTSGEAARQRYSALASGRD